jgi:alpha-L-fucosidase
MVYRRVPSSRWIWQTAEGKTSEGIRLRFTQSDSAGYATLLGTPKTPTITLKSTVPKAGTQIYRLGEAKPLVWSQHGSDINVTLPTALPGQYAYVLKDDGSCIDSRGDSVKSTHLL